MGSLMPSWNNHLPGVPPKGFEPTEEELTGKKSASLPAGTLRHRNLSRTSTGGIGESRNFARTSLGRTSVDSTKSQGVNTEEPTAPTTPGGTRWWKAFESSHFNDPLEETPADWKTGSYVPQTNVAAEKQQEASEG